MPREIMQQAASPSVSGAAAEERPWQRITVPFAAEVASRFDTPPPEYGMVVWWGWEGPMTEDVIIRDLDRFQELGFPCIMLESGYGMSPKYLSHEWFETVRLAVEHACRRGMRVWLVDEGKYPSGFAGGKFSEERPDLRMQGLVVAETIDVAAGETVVRQVPPETVGAIAVNQEDNSSQVLDVAAGELRWQAPQGQWQTLIVQHQFRTAVTRSVNNPTRQKDDTHALCDYLNAAAVRQFIEFTHEQHKKYLGTEFGRTVLGFRGDEPDFAHTPWTPALPDEFERRKGYDVRPYLASFFAPRLSEDVRKVKADYWDVWSDIFRDSFFRVQAEWCAAHNLEYVVHLNHEDKTLELAQSEGDFFKAMRHVQLPGVDAIWNQIWPDKIADFPKLASSAAHLFGRPRAFSESFAVYHDEPTIETGKWVMDHQFVRGINLMEIMFYPTSANPEGRHMEWLDSEEFPALATYVNRATYLLTMGRPAAQIAVYFPTYSLWLDDKAANTSVWDIAQQLLEQQRDFDFVDDQTLSSLLKLEGDKLENLSGQSYSAVIVPSISSISKAALDRLEAFVKAGGHVIFFGRTPSLVVEKSFLSATAPTKFDWAMLEASGELTPQVIAALPQPDVSLDQPCASIKYLHRRLRDADLYFFFNESTERQSRQVSLAGNGQVRAWDAFSGRIEVLADAVVENGTARLSLDLKPYETRFLVAGA